MISRWMARQLGRPEGLGGRLVARMMNRSNAAMNRRAIALLDVRASHEVLEVGFGGGLALDPLLALAWAGRVTGVEPSADMREAGRRRHAAAIASGRLRLDAASVERLPYAPAEFDRVLSVNTLYFWPDPAAGLAEMYRVMRPGGSLVLGYRPAAVMRRLGFTRHGFRLYEDEAVLRLVGDAGFEVLALEEGREGLGHTTLVAWRPATDA
jgi:SAM-dependent methyltransferase